MKRFDKRRQEVFPFHRDSERLNNPNDDIKDPYSFDAIYKSPPISKARARAQRPFWPTVLLPFRDWQSYRDWKVSKERSRERSQVRACNCLLNRNRTCCRPWSRLPLMLKIIQFLYYRCITRVRACSGNAYYLPHLCQPEENTLTIAADRRIDVSF